MVFFALCWNPINLVSQDLSSCADPYIIDLSVGYEVGGYGLKECGCSEDVDYCELIYIIMRKTSNGQTDLIECNNISLTERWWREQIDYVDIYDPLTCEEYPESPTHFDRYDISTDHLNAGDTLQLLVCKTDPFNQNLIELSASPGSDCNQFVCPPIVDCPATFKLRKNLDCEYILPDFTLGVSLSDSCQQPPIDVTGDYVIMQIPPAGTLIDEETFVEISIQNLEGVIITTCDVFVTLAGDAPPVMNEIDPISDIVFGDVLPEFQVILAMDTIGDGSIIQLDVETSIIDYTATPCEGYTITYRWEAIDGCNNSTVKTKTFNVLPDTISPLFLSVPIDTDTILAGQQFPVLVDLVAGNNDGSTTGITMTKSIDSYEEDLCQGYPVTYRWEAIDQCNNKSELSKTFFVKPLNAAPIFLSEIDSIADIKHGDLLPTPQQITAMTASGDMSGVTVIQSITPYIENACAPYPIEYVWIASDSCNNTASVSTMFMVRPDTVDLSVLPALADISLSVLSGCNQTAPLVIPTELNSQQGIAVSISITDEYFNPIDDMSFEEGMEFSFGIGISHVIYSVSHSCGAVYQDTIQVTAADITPPVFNCNPDQIVSIDNPLNCSATANWPVPVAYDNCSNPIVTQIAGPNQGEEVGVGTYMIAYQAVDASGNKDTCEFELAVRAIEQNDFTCNAFAVDLNEACEAIFDFSILREQQTYKCLPNLEVLIIIEKDTLRGPTVDLGPYKGKDIYYQLCDNSTGLCCQNRITLNDDNAPVIICDEDVFLSCLVAADGYRPQVAAECGEVTWKISDAGLVENCEKELVRGSLLRTFIAIDANGNESLPCTQRIFIEYAQIKDQFEKGNVKFPNDTTILCDYYNFNLLRSDHAGVPYVGDLPVPPYAENVCGIQSSYEDELLASGSCTKIIIRKWTLIEPRCNYGLDFLTHKQIIKVVDRTAPIIFPTVDKIRVETASKECHAEFHFPRVEAWDNCQDPSTLRHQAIWKGITYTESEAIPLPYGVNSLIIKVSDSCNNSAYDTLIVEVHDPIIPLAVCYEHTTINLSSESVAFYARSIDAGSYDNCFLDKIEINRNDLSCDPYASYFKDYVIFCCADLGKMIEVNLKVTDYSGNINYCTGLVHVTDKNPPKMTIPPDLTVDCKVGISVGHSADPYGHLFGTPNDAIGSALSIDPQYIYSSSGALLTGSVVDDCPSNVEVIVSTESNVNNCGIGSIQRTFIAIDAAGNASPTQTQYINVTGETSFDTSLIRWPSLDTTIIECTDIRDVNPDILGRPELTDAPCALYGITYDDTYFELIGDTNGACSKMTRKWTVINWCDPSLGTQATRTQIIKLIDPEAPVLDPCEEDVLIVYGQSQNCNSIPVFLTKRASDNCTSDQHLIWSLQIDESENGSIDNVYRNLQIDSNGYAQLETNLPPGQHLLHWSVTDQCGNQSECTQSIYVDNNKAPTPYAIGLSTTISNEGTVEVWASDLQAKSDHPCYDDVIIRIARHDSRLEDASDVLQFDCDDVGENYIHVYAYRHLVDGTLVADFTTVIVDIQDNGNYCSNETASTEAFEGILGSVATTYGAILPQATVELKDMLALKKENTLTNAIGKYAFPSLKTGRSYSISVDYQDLIINGLTTRDIIFIQQHLMGIRPFTSHWKMIQSDVNQDQKVSAIDIVELRRAIIGQESNMDDFSSWKFMDASIEFEPIQYPWIDGLNEGYYIVAAQSGFKADFTAIKLGDLDDSAILSDNWARTRSELHASLFIQDQFLQKGEELEFQISIDAITTYGWQWELIASEQIEIIGFNSNYTEKGIFELSDNSIRASVSQSNKIIPEQKNDIITIQVRALEEVQLSKALRLDQSLIKAELYDDNLDIYQLALEFQEAQVAINLSHPYPNPFGDFTTVTISLDQAQAIELSIVDLKGSVISEKTIACNRGDNAIKITRDNFPVRGVYVAHFKIDRQQYTRRLIVF